MEDLVKEQAAIPAMRRIREHLLRLKAPIDREIREYPTPIAGCDAQFNHLLDERRRLAHDLRRLDEIEGRTPDEQRQMLKILVKESSFAGADLLD